MKKQGEADPFIGNVFTLETCAPVIGSQVLSYSREKDLLAVSYCKTIYFYERFIFARMKNSLE